MTYTLILGDPAYSSWSLRAWLMVRRFGLPATVQWVDFSDQSGVAAQIPQAFPARTVPTLLDGDGTVIWDSLAIAEELAQRHPEAGLWPLDPAARATARSLAAEMHCSYGALRSACPMNLRVAYSDFAPSQDVRADVARIDSLWTYALERHGGPWLCGEYSAADAFFAPVAARIATYALPVSAIAAQYVAAHLNDPAFRRWRSIGLSMGADLPWYAMDHAQTDWPGPAPRPAQATQSPDAVNGLCPYSGNPARFFLEMDDTVYGFCNALCRDKTAADPEAWPEFMALVDGAV